MGSRLKKGKGDGMGPSKYSEVSIPREGVWKKKLHLAKTENASMAEKCRLRASGGASVLKRVGKEERNRIKEDI